MIVGKICFISVVNAWWYERTGEIVISNHTHEYEQLFFPYYINIPDLQNLRKLGRTCRREFNKVMSNPTTTEVVLMFSLVEVNCDAYCQPSQMCLKKVK